MGLLLSIGAGSAFAFSCAYTGDVEIELINETVTVSKGSQSQIVVNGVPCDGATASNTRHIFIYGRGGNDTLVIDMAGGRFEPGAPDGVEEPGLNEIEFVVRDTVEFLQILGNSAADTINIGAGQDSEFRRGGFINLNGDDDADVFVESGFPDDDLGGVIVRGRGGNDVITGKGGKGTGGPSFHELILDGGDGDDSIQGGEEDDFLIGGPGNDTLDGDSDDVTGDFDYSCESDGDVYLDPLTGQPTIDDDDIDGDTVVYRDAAGPVTVDLDPNEGHPGIATGDGTDTLQNIENVIGSPAGDTLSGDNNNNVIMGGGGDDTIAGDAGHDCLFGNEGNDTFDENEGDGQNTPFSG